VARKGKGFTRRRIFTIAVGVILLIFLANVTLTGGQNLFLANPFAEDLNFSEISNVFRTFSIVDVDTTELEKLLLADDRFEILGKNCFVKLRTDVTLDNGQIIPLNSRQQFFSELTTFALRTTSTGTEIKSFSSDVRMNCDLLQKKDGTRLPFTINSFAGSPPSPVILDVWALDDKGQNRRIKSEIIGLTNLVIFDDSMKPDPLDPSKLLFIGNERSITKKFTISASDLENLIGGTTSFVSRVEFRISGQVDYNQGFLAQQIPNTFPIRHGLDQGLLINSFDVRVDKPIQAPDIFGQDRKSEITSVDTGDPDPRILVTDGGTGRELVQVFAKLTDYNLGEEGVPTLFLFKQDPFTGQTSSFAESSGQCSNVGFDGLATQFQCRMFVRNDANVGRYLIQVQTDFAERQPAFSSITVVRSGAPIGVEGCPDGFVPDPLGGCVRFGTEGGGFGVFACPENQEKNSAGECVVPEAGQEPCPNGEFRNRFNICQLEIGGGGVGTKSCVDCQATVIRTVTLTDMCPVFDCDGFMTDPDGIPNCSDNKPADILPNGGFTCDRVIGTLGGLLPILVDCEGEGREPNTARGEVCAPPFIIGLFENIVPLIIGIIILIIFIAILSALVKRSPAGIISRGFRS
jgi:hypothetical protein